MVKKYVVKAIAIKMALDLVHNIIIKDTTNK